ncbi:AMP-binding protein [Oceanisphaera arctica]|uniref:AMP-dependent synthetase n=1 Tax=Oceanisphaera arctica TaxID=641510 RepID=A0A2P5TPR5_9GAMM|nr:AMP-binding protein [Oceanisphaera arctica]PPL17677.1 AMP-dependent synthetase [Oceanisphaera arctica]GHA18778.1 long-chain acyl-CoA synthetase [Oceanisphaera arctica]
MTHTPDKLPLEMLYYRAEHQPEDVYLHQPKDGHWHHYSWSRVLDQASRLVAGLNALGLAPGDKVALLSKNCAEWFICDFALQMGGFVSVPIYPTAGADTVRYVLEHSESRAIITGKLDEPSVQEPGIPEGILRIAMPYPSTMHTQHSWDSLLAHDPIARPPAPTPDRLMSLVYTSGSTGHPKGVIIDFGAYAAACQGIVETVGLNSEDRAFSYLPLSHITERVYVLGASLYGGVQVGFAQSLDTFIDDVKTISPTVFISVPRLWTNFRSGILARLPQKKLNVLLKIPFISGLVKKKIRAGLGLGDARVLGCGSAPVSPSLLRWYEQIDMPITEAWGMTENLAYSTLNYPFRSDKVGTVGKPGVHVDIRIADNGEILCRCPGMMRGYYKQESATRETLQDAWLHTGDQGALDDEGYLTITGRIKDAFKTAKGKYVLPVPIESMLTDNALIEQACVIGSGQAQPLALVQLAEGTDLHHKGPVAEQLNATLDHINRQLESHQRLGGILVMQAPWTIENNIMTPTLKIKRHLLEQQYADLEQRWPKGSKIQWEQLLPEKK